MIKSKQSPRIRSQSNFQDTNNQFLNQVSSPINDQKGATQQLNKLSQESFGCKDETNSPYQKESGMGNFGIKNLKNLGVKQKFKNKNRMFENSMHPTPKISTTQPKSSSGQYITQSSHKLCNRNFSARSQLEGKLNPQNQSLLLENTRLKDKVCLMVSQFQQIQSRLNRQLSKRKLTNRKGGQSRAHSLQNRSSQQVWNAEQRCKIYKKQIESLKNRYSIFTQQKVNRLSQQLDKLKRVLKSYENENKQLKRAIKQYESKIYGMGGTQNHKFIKQEIEGLRAQNKRLNTKIRKDEQEERMQQLVLNSQRIKLKRETQIMQDQRRKAAANDRSQKMQKELQKRNQQIKELQDLKRKYDEQKYQLENDIKDLKNKNYDNQFEIKKLLAENNKHRHDKDQLKKKLQSKQDQFIDLQSKLQSYQKENSANFRSTEEKQIQTQFLQQEKTTLIFTKDQLRSQELKQALLQDKFAAQKQFINEDEHSKEEKVCQKQELSLICQQQNIKQIKQQTLPLPIKKNSDDSSKIQQAKVQLPVQNIQNALIPQKVELQLRDQPLLDIFKQESMKAMVKIQKYPLRLFLGESQDQSLKWNHYQFASKIKEIQVMQHINGHIKSLNFRYQKGEPLKLQKGQYSCFVCSQSQEFIKKIKFIFMNGILFSIWALSNFKREWSFGNVQTLPEEKLQILQVGIRQLEYPSCVFGENINEGIVRIGCLVEQSKNESSNLI